MTEHRDDLILDPTAIINRHVEAREELQAENARLREKLDRATSLIASRDIERDRLRENIRDYADACRQKQEIIDSWDAGRKAMQEEHLRLRAALEDIATCGDVDCRDAARTALRTIPAKNTEAIMTEEGWKQAQKELGEAK